ncbi:ribosomal protein S18-alanine N-acetyltransferase [Halorussus amylolyticus]|uniref:ribosomal protein S18-alanine N-acetyltransferase n=1 Tax=Halorussus amylolyticus TaxID=1126242 RepID=UPI001EE48159|nr:ribosomal protein S18-alanine N-acetyltransferase [Halorussus amylolyticus]
MTTTGVGDGDEVRIRQAVQADLLAVLRIERASFPQPWPFSAFERYLGEPGFLVAVEDSGRDDSDAESVVGYVVADLVPNHGRAFGHIKDIAVHPDRRGEGVGRTLLGRALAVLGTRGARSVKLEVRASNDPAISLYEEFGFEFLRTLPRYYDDGEDALILVVDLNDS